MTMIRAGWLRKPASFVVTINYRLNVFGFLAASLARCRSRGPVVRELRVARPAAAMRLVHANLPAGNGPGITVAVQSPGSYIGGIRRASGQGDNITKASRVPNSTSQATNIQP